MKPFRILAIALAFACLCPPTALAQNTSTQGKEFWLSFMHNGFKDHSLGGWVTTQVLISAKRDCSGTVSNPNTGWERSFTVRANNITTVDIPEAQGYHGTSNYETVSNFGIKVLANDTISVFCTNIAYVSFDASFVLPVESLGDDYIIQCYDQSTADPTSGNTYVTSNQTSAFLIVATEDNTEIDITPSCATLGGRPAGETFSITMNAGETYQVRSTRSGSQRDLSGTRVVAADCKKIAVFNGNTLTCIPINMGNGYDHIFEQVMPLRSWGKNFVVTNSLNRNRDFVKITSSADNNVINKNGVALATLNAYESYIFSMPENDRSCFLQAEQPCAVYLYNNSSYDQNPLGGLGDPSMVWIAPVEQRIDDVTFSTFDHENIDIEVHSVNIIVNTEDINSVYVDGHALSPLQFSRVEGNNDYSFTRFDIQHGVHRIECANGFNAHVYGFGGAKGYAYLVGSNAIDLSTNLSLNNETITHNGTFPYCVEEPITFSIDVNLPNYTLLWDFGDGTTSTQNPVNHTYHDRRVYSISVVVTSDEGGCIGSASDTTRFYVDASQQYVTESDAICAGELYSGYGFNNVLVNNDTILARLQDNPIHPECKDSLLVYITARPNYHVPINDSRCWQGTPAIYDGYGFSFEYDGPGSYERTLNLQTTQGCDSIVTLTLSVADQVTYDFNHYECSGTYVWDGRTYNESGDYSYTYTSVGGCDSIATLHLTMAVIQHAEFDTIICGTFVWDDMEYNVSGAYNHVYTASDGCDSIVTCNLTIGGTVEGASTTITSCDQYEWEGSTYTETGQYSVTHYTALGCDSIVRLNLTINRSPQPSDIFPADTANVYPHWVVTATEFQINSYDFHFWDLNSTTAWDSVRWEFENEDIQWLLEPDSTTNPIGKTCKMYVLDRVEDTVWLKATAYNPCNPQGAERRYWFVCSFYGIDENGSSTGSEIEGLEVIPNPNNGTMHFYWGKTEGRVDVTIYNMQGQIVDRINLTATPQSLADYDFGSQKNGIYFFVFNNNGCVVTKKIVITE